MILNLGASLLAFGRAKLNPAALISESACGLRCGRFALDAQACELFAFISAAAFDLGLGRSGLSFRPYELEARFAH